MSTTRSILRNIHLGVQYRSQASITPQRFLEISMFKDGRNFRPVSLSIVRKVHNKSDTKMDMTVYNSVQPGVPLPTGGPPSNSWKHWILGAIFSIILPFWKHKWAPLLALKNEVDMVVDRVERVAEFVEKVAEEVEEVADEVGNQLPEGGKLKDALNLVENLAKQTAKNAQLADDLIDKVQATEEKIESLVETIMDQENGVAKEDSDQNK